MYTGYTGPESTITVNESQGSTLENVRYDMNYISSNIYAEYTPKLGDDHRSSCWAAGTSRRKSTVR